MHGDRAGPDGAQATWVEDDEPPVMARGRKRRGCTIEDDEELCQAGVEEDIAE